MEPAMASMVVDGDAPLICFADAVVVVYDTGVDERSYVDETVNVSVIHRLKFWHTALFDELWISAAGFGS